MGYSGLRGSKRHLQTAGSRLARDFECYATTVAAFICLAMIRTQAACCPFAQKHFCAITA